MSDFVHDGWSLYIAIITLASLVLCPLAAAAALRAYLR